MNRRSRGLLVLTGVLVASCVDAPTQLTSETGSPGFAIASASIVAQLLPTSLNVSVSSDAVGGGFVFGGTCCGQPYPGTRVFWSDPFATANVLVAAGRVYGANAAGDAIGRSGDIWGMFLRDPGTTNWTFVPLDLSGRTAGSVVVDDINDFREGVGISASAPTAGLYWSSPTAPAVFLTLPPVAGVVIQTHPKAINNNGDIAGWIVEQITSGKNTYQYRRAVIWKKSGPGIFAASVLPTSSATANATATSINDAGQVVGDEGTQAILWTPSGSTYTRTIVSASVTGTGAVIDRCGRVAGAYSASNRTYGFVWEAGVRTTLPDVSGWQTTNVVDFDEGRIVGASLTGKGSSSRSYATLWTVPACP